MFGLFKCSYDYYEWRDLVCVSDSVEKLKAYYGEFIDDYLLVEDEQEHEKLKNNESSHYYIFPVQNI